MHNTLGTYDVQNVTLESVSGVAGAVDVRGELANNTDALGCLIIVKSSSDSTEHYQIAVNENDSCTTTVSNLERDTYSVLVYDLERDGLPGSTPAISMGGVVVSESSRGQLWTHMTHACTCIYTYTSNHRCIQDNNMYIII